MCSRMRVAIQARNRLALPGSWSLDAGSILPVTDIARSARAGQRTVKYVSSKEGAWGLPA